MRNAALTLAIFCFAAAAPACTQPFFQEAQRRDPKSDDEVTASPSKHKAPPPPLPGKSADAGVDTKASEKKGDTTADAGAPAQGGGTRSGETKVGTVGSRFHIAATIAFRGTLRDGRPGVRIVLSDTAKGLGCDLILTAGGASYVWIEIPEDELGIVSARPAGDLVFLDKMDGDCGSSPETAASGSVAVSVHLAGIGESATGVLSAGFAGGEASGTFDVPLCFREPQFGQMCL